MRSCGGRTPNRSTPPRTQGQSVRKTTGRGHYSNTARNLWPPPASDVVSEVTRMTAQPLSPAKIYAQAELDPLGDEALVELVRGRNELAVRTLTRRYNRRLFRIARSVLRNDAEAEDVVQESWVRAFAGLDRFRGESAFATWLTRIAINEALGRKRRLRPTVDWETYSENKREAEIIQFPASAVTGDPERTIARSEIREALERSIDDLPEK